MMSTTVDISIIILFKTKDIKFYRALRSAQFASEIMVVENQKINDFSRVRNQAMENASHEWVFFLDSDEMIASASIPEIKSIVRDNILDGVVINRQDVFYGHLLSYGEAGKSKLLRMGKRNKITWQRPVHEIARVRGQIGGSNIKVIHDAHDSIDEFMTAIINYSQLEANYRIQDNRQPNLYKLVFYPIGKFIHNYFFKRGYADGWAGFCYAFMMSLHSFGVRVFQYELKFKDPS